MGDLHDLRHGDRTEQHAEIGVTRPDSSEDVLHSVLIGDGDPVESSEREIEAARIEIPGVAKHLGARPKERGAVPCDQRQ